MTDTAEVRLWGRTIGAVTWVTARNIGVFQYTPEFARSGIQVAPLMMPLRETPYEFPTLDSDAFKGLPGMLADCLPDTFGNTLINAWLATQGRSYDSFTPVERLCYTGTRGIGALEFQPAHSEAPDSNRVVAIDALVALSNRVLDERVELTGKLSGSDDQAAIEDILRVSTSAGGARAKAVLAWNERTGEFRSGQAPADSGFTHWLMKFDGIHGNRDKELADPLGYGRIEYAYALMAAAAGITMERCRLHEEGGRAHFMTRRFDRSDNGGKRHMQSLGALQHFDFNRAGAHSYEAAIATMQQLDLPASDLEQQVMRAYINILARNQDDHVKNIAFLMSREGQWRLSPAFDFAYAYNPQGAWTGQHQMRLNMKQDYFVPEDLLLFASSANLKPRQARALLARVSEAVRRWPHFANEAGVDAQTAQRIEKTFRHDLLL
ncbi:MAG: HipA domain-containing protein [Pseudomonadota bacterium]